LITTQIVGGLGNQLFQIATGRALASRLGVEMRLDTRYFKRNLPVQDDLYIHHFSHSAREAHPRDVPAVPYDGLCTYLMAKLRGYRGRIFREKSLAYDPAFETLQDNTYLSGYWQSELYFKDYADEVRAALRIVTPPSTENAEVLAEIGETLAVSLHIRRGDYVTNAKFNAIYGTCDLDYYRAAAEMIAEKTGQQPTFFAFSDDPQWVRDNLSLPYHLRIIGHNTPATSYEDIRLMSACRHHILANSSFSWWGAWLNPRADKIVISPRRWLADPKLQQHDIISRDWITI